MRHRLPTAARCVRPGAACALLLAAIAIGCAAPRRPAEPVPWPVPDWQVAAPESQGVEPGRLADLLERVERGGLRLHGLLVVRHGRLVHESYAWPFDATTPHDIASCTKSVVGLLAGIAWSEGHLRRIDAPLVDPLSLEGGAPRSAHKAAMTLRHLLTMTSGLENRSQPVEQTLFDMLASPDWARFSAERRLVALPGGRWSYDSAGVHLVAAILRAAVGRDLLDYARERLFDPIGVGPVDWPADPQGIRRGWGDVRMRPRDMARLGLLMLQEGRWEGTAVVPAPWVADATRDQTDGAEGAPTGGYGYLWWPGPDGAFFAAGRGGQYVFVSPALDLVVVTTAAESRERLAGFAAALEEDLLPGLHEDALPPDPEGTARLAAVAARRAVPPSPTPPPPPPPLVESISGRTFALPPEPPFGWQAVALTFDGGAAATLTPTVAGTARPFAVGLDGVPRLTPGGGFVADPRHADSTLALTGRWEDERTFVVTFDTLARIDRGTISLRFDDAGVAVALVEETTGVAPVALRGTLLEP